MKKIEALIYIKEDFGKIKDDRIFFIRNHNIINH